MKQYLPTIIAVLAAINLALFSIETADNPHSGRSGRTYSYNPAPNAWNGMQSVVQGDSAGSVIVPLTEVAATTESLSTMPAEGSPLSAPPALLETSAMAELTPVQLPPLDAGMVNVTGVANDELRMRDEESEGENQRVAGGYRIAVPVAGSEYRIALPYDPSLLPQGFTEEDIQTYVYDRQHHRWAAIQRDSVNEAELLVCSRFRPWEKGLPRTRNDMVNPQDVLSLAQDMVSFASQGDGGGDSPLDFINAVLKTPEMPETSAYTPTSIKELKAADPLEGLTLIQPPTANNSGTANLSYPIEIPAGRQGMQPNLTLTYSSSGGNGWLGVGWDIPIPSITVETRWGVPRYDQGKESEVYVYEGEQLVTKNGNGTFREMPHRTNQWTDRSALGNEEQFFPRKNEAFDSIVRHGSSPDSYWWTVTHKNGVTDYYGKYASDNSVNNNCVLRAGASNYTGPIAHWALAESVDPDGNSVRYYYSIEYYDYIAGGRSSTPGRQIYIDTIFYTAKGDDFGKYKIMFTRKLEKSDVSIVANRGFKEVTASLLCNIAVCFNDRAIRHYFFKTEGGRVSNYKTRLTDVVQLYKSSVGALPCSYIKELGVSDTVITTHFEYYDLPEADSMFSDTVLLPLTDDEVKSTFITSGGALAKATALGGTRGKSWNIGGTATLGGGPVVPLTTISVGGNFNYSRSKSEGALTLIDLDGDGLADKVYKKGKKIYYRRHIAESEYRFHYDTQEHELMDYSNPLNPQGIRDFLSEVSSTSTWGLQLSVGLAYSGSWPTTKSTTSVYFADVNADGLPDLVTDDGVLFNVTERDGIVKFRNYYTIASENSGTGNDSSFVYTSTDTCGGIIFNGEVSDSIVCQTEWILDTVFILKINQDSDEVYAVLCLADSLERTGHYRCSYTYYQDYPDQIQQIAVYRSGILSCTLFSSPLSASGLLEQDPDLETVRVWVAPKDGTVMVTSNICLVQDSSVSRQQSKTCDGVSYAIQHSNMIAACLNHTLTPSTPSNTFILDTGHIGASDYPPHFSTRTASVKKNDLLLFRLISGDNHDFDNVDWHQTILYLNGGEMYDSRDDYLVSGNKCFGAGKPDPAGNNRMDISFKISTGALYSNSFSPKAKLRVEIVDTAGHVCSSCKQSTTLENEMSNVPWTPFSSYHVPENHHVRIYVECNDHDFPWSRVHITPHIGYYVHNGSRTDTVECYPPVDMRIENYENTVIDSVYHRLFGPLYKGWGQFAYHNNDTLSDGTIIHDDIVRLERLVADWDNYPDKKNKANKRRQKIESFDMVDKDSTQVRESSEMLETLSVDSLYSPVSLKTSWVEMDPDFRHQAWVGYGNINFVTKNTMCNTRMPGYYTDTNTVDIEEYDHPVPIVAGYEVKTVRKQNYSKMKNHSLSLSAPMVPFSAGTSVSKGYNLIVTDYMDMNGDRYPDIVGPSRVQYSKPWGGIGEVREVGIFDNGVTRSETMSNGMNFGGSYEIPSRGTSNNPKNSKISFNGSGNAGSSLGGGSDRTSMTWMDINGDGLPDQVVEKDNTIEVSLNTGYGVLDKDVLYISGIRNGESMNWGLNIGGSFNIGQASIGGGLGVNFSMNETKRVLMDFNGDGWPDIVENPNGVIKVRYNCGNGSWSSPEYFNGLPDISFGRSFSESADVSVTLGFTFFSVLKVCVGLSGSPYSRTFSKDSVQLTDVNGDGYIDYVTSKNEGSMTVRYNQSGKTNLLRKVTNFTGSTIELDYDMPAACYDKPQRSWNLASVETRNNVDTCPVGGNRTHTTFRYEYPNYNRYERMDYGYRRVISCLHDTENNDSLYRYTIEDYNNQNFAKRGRKTRDCVYDASGAPYVEHIFGDTLYDYAGNVVSDDGCARTDIYVKKEVDITNWYEGNATPQITSMVEREYDRYRNVTKYVHYGNTGCRDEWFRAEISYAPNMPHNMVSLPTSMEVYSHGDSLLQKRTAVYNPYNGKMETLCLHNNLDITRYDFGYDSYGNMDSATMPANASGQRLAMQYQYDTIVRSYPVRVDNISLGYYSTTEYDYRFGKPTKTTDINGYEMWYGYDSLGRMVTVTAPYEQGTAPYTIRMEYHPHNFRKMDVWTNSPNPYSYACTFHYDRQHPGNPIRTTLVTDGLGRLLQTKKDAEIGGQEVSLVTGKVVYDCFGRTVTQYHPFAEDKALYALYNDSVTTGTGTVTEYDILDRQTRIELPTHEMTEMEYGFDTLGGETLFSTITTDAMGNSVQILKGTLGQQLKQTAPYNTVTLFEYNCLGQLTKSTDPDGFETRYEYDMLGRTTHRTHPDAGDDYYVYDPAGNIVQHINGNGRTADYTYFYNLLTRVSYPGDTASNVRYIYGGPGADHNAVGRVLLQEDASGWQAFSYGKLGEVTENIRTFVFPFETQPMTLAMSFQYDSWNRIQEMIYPDGETVSYAYDRGGMLKSVTGEKNEVIFNYIDSIRYNEFGLKESVFYGNGSHAEYSYDLLMRLSHLYSENGMGEPMQDIDYTYDAVGNITDIANNASMLSNGLGGEYWGHHDYDDLYRLEHSEGEWGTGTDPLRYDLNMGYHSNGRIQYKTLSANVLSFKCDTTHIDYDNLYSYQAGCSRLREVLSLVDTDRRQVFNWDNAGNMVAHGGYADDCTRNLCWDGENRLVGFSDCRNAGFYQYDANGERIYKLTGQHTYQNIGGEWHSYMLLDNPTLYASPYLVATPQGYTKHYYAENERIASKIGSGGLESLCRVMNIVEMPEEPGEPYNPGFIIIPVDGGGEVEPIGENPIEEGDQVQSAVSFALNWGITDCMDGDEPFGHKRALALLQVKEVMNCVGASYTEGENLLNLYEWENEHDGEPECYWYHPDHLGSSSWITDSAGRAVQHLHYLPWGEDFVDQRTTNWSALHTFSAKERDAETGLSYFGSRYYSSDLSIWLSVDPMSDKYPSLSPYVYCANNPIKLVDPNGEKVKTTLAFQNSAYNQVFQNLAETNTTYQRIISKYQDNNHDFILDYSTELTSKAGSNQMSYTIKAGKITYTKANSKYYRPNGGDQCEIAMVKTLLHEAVHAEDGLSRRPPPSHNGFDQSSVLSGLIEYNSTYNLGYSTEELEILSWSGLEESKEYKDFIEHRATINNRTFEEEKNYVETANTLLIYGGSLDD